MKVNSKKFWNWSNSTDENETNHTRVLSINGPIAEDSWFDDDVTPALFKDELKPEMVILRFGKQSRR